MANYKDMNVLVIQRNRVEVIGCGVTTVSGGKKRNSLQAFLVPLDLPGLYAGSPFSLDIPYSIWVNKLG